MELSISLDPAAENRLRERAKHAGLDFTEFIDAL